ncbi:MAG: hypothetical protein M0R74_10685 [Dehalococcoidia bacterium]|nr:hypothetical protein [Dehalococcoidia bacterium]
MGAIKIPRYRYSLATYPNMDPAAEGQVIPERYGTLYNLVPICIDLNAGKWKLNRREIHAITAVREAGQTLISGSEYTSDLANAEFTIGVTPVLQPSTVYYFVLESDYTIDGVNYLGYGQQTDGSKYTGGTLYYINGAGTWTDQAKDLYFRIWAKASLEAKAFILVDNWVWVAGWNYKALLRASAANTRIAQSFKTPASGGPWYLSNIQVEAIAVGSPSASRTTRASVLSAYSPSEIQVGVKSYRMENYTGEANRAYFPQRGAATDLTVDIEGIETSGGALMTNVADIIQDIQANILDGDADALNAADLVALKAARTETLALNLDTEIDFESIINKLESGQLWKYIPLLDGTIGLKFAAAGEPAGTPHYRDEHFKSFKMRRKWSAIYERVKVKYAQDGGSGEFLVAEAEALSAKYLYRSMRTLEVETFLTNGADALLLAEDYLGTSASAGRRQYLCWPTVEVEFELRAGLGWELIPSMKVKLTRARAMSASGALDAVLFYVMDVQKDSGSGMVKVTAILDAMTY